MTAGEWVPGRWWRVTYSDGRRYTDGPNAGELQVWCETSDAVLLAEADRRVPVEGRREPVGEWVIVDRGEDDIEL
ncbi:MULTISPECIES: hypothetical protein, partial [unclassified Mycobacterium]|uniref:hypothetical protein n=1 Tax=unclassified Mycobacterium TaxID=2642494 RepID=UPI0029C78C96